MQIQPTFLEAVDFGGDPDLDTSQADNLIQCCDSAAAVLDEAQLAEWLLLFRQEANSPEASTYCDYYTATMVFDIEGQRLVVVADSGGEMTSGSFQVFCEERGVRYQTIIDTLDFEGVEVEDMYTGNMAENDHPDLLALVRRITN